MAWELASNIHLKVYYTLLSSQPFLRVHKPRVQQAQRVYYLRDNRFRFAVGGWFPFSKLAMSRLIRDRNNSQGMTITTTELQTRKTNSTESQTRQTRQKPQTSGNKKRILPVHYSIYHMNHGFSVYSLNIRPSTSFIGSLWLITANISGRILVE